MEEHTHQSADDVSRHDATGPDTSRQAATGADDYISLKEARDIFLAHNRPVSERTLQRSCVKGSITGKKITTGEGEKWFALKSSVINRIAELDKFDKLRERHDAARRDASRHVGEDNASNLSADTQRQAPTEIVTPLVVPAQESHATPTDVSRQDATSRDVTEAVARLEKLQEQMFEMTKEQIEELRRDKAMLKEQLAIKDRQLATKDMQIERFFNSERETKTLFGRLQTFMNNALRSGKPREDATYVPESDALQSGLEHLQQDQEPR